MRKHIKNYQSINYLKADERVRTSIAHAVWALKGFDLTPLRELKRFNFIER